MNHAQPLCVCRGAVYAPVPASFRKPGRVLALALGMIVASSEVVAEALGSAQKSENQGEIVHAGQDQTGIVIDTRVYRVEDDGVLVALRLAQEPIVEEPVLKAVAEAKPSVRPPEPEAIVQEDLVTRNPIEAGWAVAPSAIADLAIDDSQTVGVEGPDAEARDVRAWDAEAPDAEVSDRVTPGDILRYELIVRNTNDFTVPALALEVIEQLADGVQLMSSEEQLSNGEAKGWLMVKEAEVTTTEEVYIPEPSEAGTVRWQNTRALAPDDQMVLEYDVTVIGQPSPVVSGAKDSGNALDSSQTQLQVPE